MFVCSRSIFRSSELSRECFYNAEKQNQQEIVLYVC